MASDFGMSVTDVIFAGSDADRRTFFDALMSEAEKRGVVMPSGAELDRYTSAAAPPGDGRENGAE